MGKKAEVKENKVGGSYKMRPSVKLEAMHFIAEDENIKSFNDLLEVLVMAYIKAQRRKPRDHEKQSKMKL